ncbi:hypothetical protein OC835_005922 [Tilletia horrida]|nr:hypothetical protein OC835_005922 [Tilletia horrida]
MPTFQQEYELFEILGDMMSSQKSEPELKEQLKGQVSQLELPPTVDARWQRFFGENVQAVLKKDANLYNWTVMPECEHEGTQKAMDSVKKNPSWEEYRRIYKELTTLSQSQSTQASAAPRSALQVPGRSSGTSGLLVPGSSLGQELPAPRRSGRTLSPSARLRGYAVERNTSSHRRDAPQDDGHDSDQEEEDDDDSEEDNYEPPSNAQALKSRGRKRRASRSEQDEEDEEEDEDEDDVEGLVGDTRRGRTTKRFRATQKESQQFTEARGRQSVNTANSRVSARARALNSGTSSATAIDVDALTEQFDKEDAAAYRGKGGEDTRALRDEAKARLPPLDPKESAEWRATVINNLSSKYVLYYFDLLRRFQDRKNKLHYIWICRCCKSEFNPQAGQNSNLIAHIKGTQSRGTCPDRFQPQVRGVKPYNEFEPQPAEIAEAGSGPAGPVVHKSHRGEHQAMSSWRNQPFTAPTNPYFAAMLHAANPAAALDSIRSPRTIGRDLDDMYTSLFGQAIAAIKAGPGKFSLQHDVWTTPSGRDAFFAVHANWIDSDFCARTACIGFEQLGMDHTGAVFAGHLAGILDATGLWSKWSGLVVCDAAESNVRAARFLGHEINDPKHKIPDAAHKFLQDFSVYDNVILCFAHGLNRAVVDAAKAAGAHVTMLDKDADKIIRPTIMIDGTAVGGDLRAWQELETDKAGEKVTAALLNEVEAEYNEIDNDVAMLLDNPEMEEGEDSRGGEEEDSGAARDRAGDQDEAAAAVNGIVADYTADDGVAPASSASERLHKCLVKIRASTKAIKHFEQMIKQAYPEEVNGRTLPALRNDTRWNSFLRELRGCVKVQKAFTQLINSDDTETWTPFKLTANEWKAMERLCTSLECAETITMDVQRLQCSVAEVLLFHFILKSSLRSQLQKLVSIPVTDPAYAVVKAMNAMEIKIAKYRDKALLNETIVVATALHPSSREWLPKRYPELKETQKLVRQFLDRYVGQQALSPRPVARPTTIDERYRKFMDVEDVDDMDDDDANAGATDALTPSAPSIDEVSMYFSDRFIWDDVADGPNNTEQALKWWKRHKEVLPRLTELVLTMFAIPASTAISERGFSLAGVFCSPRRNLGPKSIQQLTTSKMLIQGGFDASSALSNQSEPSIAGAFPPEVTPVRGASTAGVSGFVTATPRTSSSWRGASQM